MPPSEEEFKAMAEAYEKAHAYKNGEVSASSDAETSGNGVGNVIKAIAIIIYIIALIWGIIAGCDMDYWHNKVNFEFGTALLYWSVGFISGTMMLGFSEIIRLLQAIKDK